MKHFDNFKQYQKDVFARLDKFDMAFKPWKKWHDVSLTDLCPCKTCNAAEELTKKCDCCPEHIQWMIDVTQKLNWYEGQDERLKGE